MQEKTKKYIGFFLVLSLGIAVGFGWGFYTGINWVVKMGYFFLKAEGVDFSVSAQQVGDLINLYSRYIEQRGTGGTRPPIELLNGS